MRPRFIPQGRMHKGKKWADIFVGNQGIRTWPMDWNWLYQNVNFYGLKTFSLKQQNNHDRIFRIGSWLHRSSAKGNIETQFAPPQYSVILPWDDL